MAAILSKHFGGGDVGVALQVDVLVHRHHLDEADEDRPVAGQRRELRDLVVVLSAHHDAIDLHRHQAGLDCGVETFEHEFEARTARDRLKAFRTQRVEREIDPPQTCGRKLGDLVF